MTVFGSAYADAYDSLYREKDYALECDLIERLLDEFGRSPAKRLLDLGCGTGGHAIPLAKRKYDVTGVDRSAHMLELAAKKAEAEAVLVDFQKAAIADFQTAAPYDAAIMMFAVLGYHRTNAEVAEALRAVRASLKPGAALVFDVWYGPAVLADKPGPRERRIDVSDGHLIRRTEARLDAENNLCTVHFTLERWNGGQLVDATHEDHVMRYFFDSELQEFANAAGMRLECLRDFADGRGAAGPRTWNAIGVMTA